MPTGAEVTPAAPAPWQHTLAILGTEVLLAGWLAAIMASRVGPIGVFAMCGVLLISAGVLSASCERSPWRSTTGAMLALCLSFMSMLPGVLFFVELLSRSGGPCYERAWFGSSLSMLLFGPALVVASSLVSPWRLTASPMTILRALHGLVWLVGAGNSLMCAMMV